MISASPDDLPNPDNRKRRQIPELQIAPPPKEPEGLSKTDLKALKKQDMRTLNMLKILIQHIMDHIKNKYKKFRHPIVEESRISYLFDEQTPGMVSTDLPEERRAQEQARPFELKKDPKGVPGLYETATHKFYYNLEIVTIEKRLSNGYYKRFKDFVADIKRLAKDAKTSGDEERILKANELVSNVEVDIQLLEDNNPALVAASEQVYAREHERAKLAKDSDQGDQNVPRIPNVPPRATGSTTQSTGPINLGEPLSGRDPVPFATPARRADHSQLTNGGSASPSHDHHHVNGYHDHDDDVAMGNTPEANASAVNTQPTQPRSQRSALTTMAQNSHAGEYHNSASTTTSGQKTSDKSKSDNRSSGPYNNSQSTNGILRDHEHPDFLAMKDSSGQSQLADTQEVGNSSSQSQPNSQSQRMGPPQMSRQPTSINAILNDAPPTKAVSRLHITLDPELIADLHDTLVSKSSGCSVEQLEQINAVLMDTLWRNRSDWDRNVVARKVGDAFSNEIKDIEQIQNILPSSQRSGDVNVRKSGSSDMGTGSSPEAGYRGE